MAESILIKSWEYLDDLKILNAFIDAIISRSRVRHQYCPDPRNSIHSDDIELAHLNDNIRHMLIKGIIDRSDNYESVAFNLKESNPPLLVENDFKWLIEQLKNESDKTKKTGWIALIWMIFQANNIEHFDCIYEEKKTDILLEEKFHTTYGPIILGSPEAEKMRNTFLNLKKFYNQRIGRDEEIKKLSIVLVNKIKNLINKFELGEFDAWWQICSAIATNATGRNTKNELEPDLQQLPTWKNLSTDIQDEILSAAKEYVLLKDAEPEKWLGTNIFYRPATAGYKALLLIKKSDPAFLEHLDIKIWQNWASIIIGFPMSSGLEFKDKTYQLLIKQAYDHAPKEIISALLKIVEQEDKQHEKIFILHKMEQCWDDYLCKSLLNTIKENILAASSVQDLLMELLSHKCPGAREYAKSLLSLSNLNTKELLDYMKVAALSLLIRAEDSGWDMVWPLINNDNELGKAIFIALQNRLHERYSLNLVDRIGPAATADLYLWLKFNFQDEKDNDDSQFTSEVSIAQFKESLLWQLKNLGTQEAIHSLTKINDTIPELNSIPQMLVHAKENLRQKLWQPLSPDQFLKLISNARTRVILNADHLLEMINESLNRLQNRLQGETPASIFLWDRLPKSKKLRPKEENSISDYVKNFLIDDFYRSGIIAMREPQIRRRQTKEGIPGENVDIFVSGIIERTKENVNVVIEIKGCWNKELKTSMKEQLLDRYLKDKSFSHGIYLVAWFDCPFWDNKDLRRDATSKMTLEETRNFFNQRANEFSKNGKTIKAYVLDCTLL